MHIVDSIPLGGIVSVRDGLIEQQAQGKKVFRLESGDPSFDTPTHVVEAIAKALRDGKTHYTAGLGILPLRETLVTKLREQNGIPVSGPNNVLVTNGAMHGLYITFRALCEPGDEIIVPDPTWTETRDNVTLAGGVVINAPLDVYTGYRYNAEIFEQHITSRTRALVVNSPHNPTGVVCTREELQAIVDLADKYGLWIVSDEAYEHLTYGPEHISLGSMGYDKVISIFSFSKSYAMSGLRLGYVAVEDDVLQKRMASLLRCTINGVNSATQWGGIAAIEGPQDHRVEMVKEFTHRKNVLWASLSRTKVLHPILPEGAFYCWAKIRDWEGWMGRPKNGKAMSEYKKSSWAMTEYLIDKIGVGSAPGSVFGPAGEGHVRFAFSCSTEQVEEAAKLLEGFLS